MPKDHSRREMHGGASLPKIGEGAILGTGVGGEIQPVDIQMSRYLRLRQVIPAEVWNFTHNTGRIPVVRILNESFAIINESVNYTVSETDVQVWTEGVSIAGYVDLFWFGPTGIGTETEATETPTSNNTKIDGGLF